MIHLIGMMTKFGRIYVKIIRNKKPRERCMNIYIGIIKFEYDIIL